MASEHERDDAGWSGTAPHFEVNYGPVPNLQLHLVAPLAYVAPVRGSSAWGYGDTELGAKLRFVQEGSWIPQIGVFPLVEVPTGSTRRGLGNGTAQVYLPLWLQKSFGRWTTYGGVGAWINPAAGQRNWWFLGWLVQASLTKSLTVGAELFHMTPRDDNGTRETRFNLGTIVDITSLHHILLSAGRGLSGPNRFQAYVAWQLTLGPGE